ncbi:MAG TPA: hypothetical protein VFH61_04730 [Thermoleophilia bacterium]|nr:hypothetical protein [Thermoleophilia bacterium]
MNTSLALTGTIGRHALDVGLTMKQAWRLFVKDIGPLLIAGLITVALSVLTIGILAGPLTAGLYGMVMARVREGRQPEVGDVFNQFDRFWSFFGATLVLVILIGLAFVTIVGGFLLATIWLYVFPLMVERGMGLGEAMKTSKDMVLENGFWEHLALVLILTIIGSIANGALALIAAPFTVVTVAVAYYMASSRMAEIDRA